MVNKALEWIRNLWIRAELKSPPWVQRAVIRRLHGAKEMVRLLARPYLPVTQAQGVGQGGPLTVAYVGWEFAKPALMDLIFVADPLEQRVGRVPFWRCGEVADLSWADLVVVEAPTCVVNRLPARRAIVLPQFVHHVLDVRGDWEDVQKRFRKTVRKNELRLVRKYGYEYDVTHDVQDFEWFYRHMYLPTMDGRHGKLSSPMSRAEAYQHFQCGLLFRIRRDGDWVSGVICSLRQDVLIAHILGVKEADARLVHEGAIMATYYATTHWANQRGYKAVNFLGTDPYLKTGWFQHKRKWGTTVGVPSHLHRRIWIQVQRDTPATSQFLKENPCVVVDNSGSLHGLIVVDDPHNVPPETRQEWEDRYVTPGLSDLIVRPVSYFAEGATDGRDPGVVIPLPLSAGAIF